MKTIKTCIIFLCMIFLCSCTTPNSTEKLTTQQNQPAPTATPQPTTTPTVPVEEIKPIAIAALKRKDLLDGCGCYFMLESDKDKNNPPYVFFGEPKGNALMNIDGKDVEVKLVHSDNTDGLKKGDKYKQTFKTGDISIQIDYVVTEACEPGIEACESTGLAITITATQGIRSGAIKATGFCGC